MEQNVFGIIPEEGTEAHRLEQTPSEKKDGLAPTPPATTPAENGQTSEEPPAPTPAPEPAPPPAPDPGRVDPATAEGDEDGELVATDGEGFRIGNVVYKDIMAADQAFRQQRGRAKAEAKRANEAQERYEKLLQENARLKVAQESPAPPEPAPATPGAPAPASAEDEGEGLTPLLTREQINDLIADEGADAAILKMQEIQEQRSQERLERGTAPLRQQEQIARYHETAQRNFMTVADLKSEDGRELFPELSDEAAASEIVATWDRLILEDPDFREHALTTTGVKHAYLVWKQGIGAKPAAPAPTPADNSQPAPTSSAGPTGEERQAAAVQRLGNRRPAPPVTPPPSNSGHLPARTEEAVRKLMAAREHPVFGVQIETRQ